MQAQPPLPEPIELFFSYSHRDEALRNELEEHLALMKRQGIIVTWHDRRIVPGADWSDEIDSRLESSRLILLLVSSSFLASDYCYGKEMSLALERHSCGEALLIPVIVRPVDWQSAPFAKVQGLPRDGKAVTSWANRDEAWTEVAQGIRRALTVVTGRLGKDQSAQAPALTIVSRHEEATKRAPARAKLAKLDPAEVRKASKSLRAIIGPIADVITTEAAAKAGSVKQLYELLAAEIESDLERSTFLNSR